MYLVGFCLLQTCSFLLHKMLIDGLESCGLLVYYYDVVISSFWRHPFTADYPLVSKWCNAKFLQICSDEETLIYILDSLGVSKFSFWGQLSLYHFYTHPLNYSRRIICIC